MFLVCAEQAQTFVLLGMKKLSLLLIVLIATAVSEVSLLQMAAPALAAPALAGPLVCTTSLEEPDPSVGSGLAPVEVTTCGTTETTSELLIGVCSPESALCPGD